MKTRMERYKELREKMSQEVSDTVKNNDLSEYANRLNKIDDEHFENMEVNSDSNYKPSRAKDVELNMYETFENEYLKDFLDEVKTYNIEKGNRHVSDTEQNILEEINAAKNNDVKSLFKVASENSIHKPIGYDDLDFFNDDTPENMNDTHLETLNNDDFEADRLTKDVIKKQKTFEPRLSPFGFGAVNYDQPLLDDESNEVAESLVSDQEPVVDIDSIPTFNVDDVQDKLAEVVKEVSEDTSVDTDALIESLRKANFIIDETGALRVMNGQKAVEKKEDFLDTSQLKTFDYDLEHENKAETEAIFKNVDQEFIDDLKLQQPKAKKEDTEQFDFNDNFDPFWVDYLQKMNELESNIDSVYEGQPSVSTLSDKKPSSDPTPLDGKRDITQEFLELTREIERENLESIDLSGSNVVVSDDIYPGPTLVSNDKDLELEKPSDLSTVITGKEVKKNRAVNALLTVALAGIILGAAVAIKYFLLK